jgi:hypothetical protein
VGNSSVCSLEVVTWVMVFSLTGFKGPRLRGRPLAR